MKNVVVEQSLDVCLNEIRATLEKQEINITNHVDHINKDISNINSNIGALKTDIGKLKTDLDWVKKIMYLGLAAVFSLIGGILIGVI